MYKKAEYALLSNKELWQGCFIVQLSYPFVVGVPMILEVDDPKNEEYQEQIRRGLAIAQCRDFSIYIVPQLSLTGQVIPKESLVRTMDEMAEFYRKVALVDKIGKYRKNTLKYDELLAERNAIKDERREFDRQKRYEKIRKELFGDDE